MVKIEKYTGEKTYMFPNGEIATPERVLQDFPAALDFVHVVETDDNSEVLFSMENLSALKTLYKLNLDESNRGLEEGSMMAMGTGLPIIGLSEEEAIQAIQDLRNAPTPTDPNPSAEERIAAALEFQNAVTMLDLGLAIEPSIVARNYDRKLWSAEQAVLALGEAAKEIGVLGEDYNNIIQILEAKETREVTIKGAE